MSRLAHYIRADEIRKNHPEIWKQAVDSVTVAYAKEGMTVQNSIPFGGWTLYFVIAAENLLKEQQL